MFFVNYASPGGIQTFYLGQLIVMALRLVSNLAGAALIVLMVKLSVCSFIHAQSEHKEWHYLLCRNLNNRKLSGAIPESIGNLSSLQTLYAHLSLKLAVTRMMIRTWLHYFHDFVLRCSLLTSQATRPQSRLTGTIPESIGKLTSNLQNLYVHHSSVEIIKFGKRACEWHSKRWWSLSSLTDVDFSKAIGGCMDRFPTVLGSSVIS